MRKITILLVGLLALSACKKKDGVVGMDGIDPNTLLNSVSVDTFSLITYTEVDDSVITKNPASALLGFLNDPKFGTTDASFYAQLRISGVNPNFGDLADISIDSVVLGLKYAGFYGEFSPLNLEVNRLTEDLETDSTYYAFSTLGTESANLIEPGFETIIPDPSGETIIGEDTVEATLRIRLQNSLGLDFITEALTPGGGFSSADNFLDYFKGLRVRTTNGSMPNGKGGIFYFNLNDPLTKLTIYYHLGSVPKSYDIVINSNSVDFNHVEVDNSGKNVQNVIDNQSAGQTEFYAQAFRSRAIIKVPGLSDLPSKALIHKAQLSLPIQHQTGTSYFPGDFTSVASHPVDDPYTLANLGVFGIFDQAKKHYLVDLRAFVQGVTTGLTENTDVVISPRYFINSADRIIFNGPNSGNKVQPKLVVTYTEY
ncbi:MAG: DUF4270 family protein [Bacteroidota bacterium]